MKSKLSAVDFFCGGGGMTCGLRKAGIRVIAGIDFDQQCAGTYRQNNIGSAFIHADITQLPIEYLSEKLGITKNDDDMIFVGCSPCQYWSIINTSKLKARKSKNLLENFGAFVREYRPGYVLVENVPGIVTGKGSPLHDFLDMLECAGYHYDAKIVNMADYGIPQTRTRYSLIASRLSPIKLPECGSFHKVTVRDAIFTSSRYPRLEAGVKDLGTHLHTCAGVSPLNLERLKRTPHDGGSRSAWKDDERLQLRCFKGKDKDFVDSYGRMMWDKPAPTITTKFYSLSNGRFAHPEQDRAISLREGATLQTFPYDYIFVTNSIAATAKLIGNAVPPRYAEILGKTIIKCHGR